MRPIDADKFMTVLNDAQIEFDENYRGLGLAKSMLFEQPTIETTPIIKAHWEQTYNGYVCSNCHSHFTINTIGAGEFCSKCGAKMNKSIQFDLSNLKIEGE